MLDGAGWVAVGLITELYRASGLLSGKLHDDWTSGQICCKFGKYG
jgi:hypothetical protein